MTARRARSTRTGRRAGTPAAAALAGAVASATLGLAIATTTPPTSRRLDAPRPIPSHGAPALDGAHTLRVYEEIDRRARGLPHEARAHVARTILEEATRAGVGAELVLSVIHVESSFRHRAASPVGALGLMQLRPSTMDEELARARVRGADPLDPAANVRAGVRYLGRLVRAFDDVDLALVAYNAGPARLRRHLADGQVPERLLRYAQHVRRGADRRAAASRRARPPAARLALAPAHGPRTARAFPAGAAGTLAPIAYAAPDGKLVSTRPGWRRRSIRWSPRRRARAPAHGRRATRGRSATGRSTGAAARRGAARGRGTSRSRSMRPSPGGGSGSDRRSHARRGRRPRAGARAPPAHPARAERPTCVTRSHRQADAPDLVRTPPLPRGPRWRRA